MTEPSMHVPEGAQTAAKAGVASLTAVGTFLALLTQVFADGTVNASEAGTLLTASVGLVTTVVAVWARRNHPK